MRRILFIFLSILAVLFGFAQTPQQQQNIKAFTKLYGYIRYFHPSDEAASIDWDAFAIYGSNQVLGAQSDQELIATLQKLFIPIAPTIQIGFNPSFDVKTIIPKEISNYKSIYWIHKGVSLSSKSTYSSNRTHRLNNADLDFAPFLTNISATQLRNKEILLKGEIKTNGDPDARGHLFLRVDKKNGVGFFNNMDNNPATSMSWKEYSFTGMIDKDAENISVGGFLERTGTIWIKNIALYQRKDFTSKWELFPIENSSFNNASLKELPSNWFFNNQENYSFKIATQDGEKALQISDHERKIETIEKSITSNIKVIFPITLYGTSKNTYPIGDSISLIQLKNNLLLYKNRQNIGENKDLYLGDVVIAWNIFKHFFPYWDDASKNPEEILSASIKKAFQDTTSFEFKQTLELMTAPLNDGHIFISSKNNTSFYYQLPIELRLIQNKFVVSNIFDSSIHDLQKGDIIKEIDGRPINDIYQEEMSCLSGSTQWKSYRAMQIIAQGALSKNAEIAFYHGDNLHKVTLAHNISIYDAQKKLTSIKRKSGVLQDNIYYLDIDRLPADSIVNWATKLSSAKGIICDLRGYPKSNHNLISYLMKKPEDDKWMFIPINTYPDQEKTEYLGSGWNLQPIKPHFNGKIVFITDGRAISYAESYMGYIKDLKLATIIGQPTAGTNGDINSLVLPGGYNIWWTGLLIKNHDGSKHHLKGIQPDIYMEPTIAGIAAGKDELLDKAIELIEQANAPAK